MATIPVVCRCGKVLKTINGNLSKHETGVFCSGCKRIVRIDYDKGKGSPKVSYVK